MKRAFWKKRKRRIRVFVVDRHPMVREGIRACLANRRDLEVVGEAKDGHEALHAVKRLVPDLVVIDLDVARNHGPTWLETLLKEAPGSRVVIFSTGDKPDHLAWTFASGASGYLLKKAPPEELLQALEAVATGNVYMNLDVARATFGKSSSTVRALTELDTLTGREREVLVQIATGAKNKEIAQRLSLGLRTVMTHRERLMRKLNVHNAAGLTRFAISEGLVSVAE